MISLHQANQESATARRSRHGFTLIELLMVIVIIGVLMSLLLPAISSVRTRAKVTEVKVEIDNLASALAVFKSKFGFYPPSRIRLYEKATGDPSWVRDTTPPLQQSEKLRIQSRAIIRRMFPQFDFKINRNINGDLDITDMIELRGAECLVFFLGGVPDSEDLDGNGQLDAGEDRNQNGTLDWFGDPIGFSKNPARPFLRAGKNRIGPFFNFDSGRIQKPDLDDDFMPEYVSPLAGQTLPYLYASAYDGRGYRPLDLGGDMINVYLQGSNTGPAWKPKSFQIICPGFDDEYGDGGKFDLDTAGDLVNIDLNGDGDFNDPGENREPERDNITNFHTGTLAP